MANEKKSYFLGLDIGTDSVGYAVTDENYNLLKFKGEHMWGVHLFEEAALNEERRQLRCERRRLDRRQQRGKLIQELFAEEIAKIDKNFFIRIKESSLYPEDTSDGANLFNDSDFTDADYNRMYPTIHHLIMELIENESPHDVRLVYLACAWLAVHRGHFLNDISKDNINGITDINNVYEDFIEYFPDEKPWVCNDLDSFGEILKKRLGVNKKFDELCTLLFGDKKTMKSLKTTENFPYDRETILKALCGGKISAEKLFDNKDYSDIKSFTLEENDDEFALILSSLGDDAELILKLKALYDWAILNDIRQGEMYISKAKVKVYDIHKEDLHNLKYIIKKYAKDQYNNLFRNEELADSYAAYAKGNSAKQADFCKLVKKITDNITPDESDTQIFNTIVEKAQSLSLCPKQVNSENRVIPYQLYYVELKAILDNAVKYLPFLSDSKDGISVYDKILSVLEFRIPYFVGPLNPSSKYAWIKRKADGKIYPWNFNELVDLEQSEQAFIDRMTNNCTYLPGEDVLPKMSLCYQKFGLLNTINALSVNGTRIPVAVKQELFNNLCTNRKKITKKAIKDYLKSNNYYTESELLGLEGVDDTLTCVLSSYISFKNLLQNGTLTEDDVENIICRRTYTESKSRFTLWLEREYPNLSEADRKYIGSLKFKDFGRLSKKFLCGLYGAKRNSDTGEAMSVLERMWNENVNLMEILSDKYTYSEQIEYMKNEYYDGKNKSVDDRLDEMYVSNSVKRPIVRTLDIISDIVKAEGAAPKKIFVETARGGTPEQKGKRTQSRFAQILDLYNKCDTEEVRELNEQLQQMGSAAESRLQSDKLFLYYMQLGKCMYTGTPINLSQLSTKQYDIDHIRPQSKVKDDSVLNNKVLVLSTANAEKGDIYPIKAEIRNKFAPWWKFLRDNNFITDEKYKRLTRSQPFSESELWGFINRQLVDTRQSTKAVAEILKELYPTSDIVYVKAGIVSEFRQEFDLLKSRSVNDLHHAKDAYLNIAVGNVYHEKFTKKWFLSNYGSYNLKIKTLFTHPVQLSDNTSVWLGEQDLIKVKNTVQNKNAIHLTRYSFCRKGGLFDRQPLAASEGLVPLKKGLPTEKYGGYRKPTASYFMLVKYKIDKKDDLFIMPVELMYSNKVSEDIEYAKEYAKKTIGGIIGKNVISVDFPLGLRKIKVGTVLEFDKTSRVYITGKAGGGKRLLISVFNPLIVGYEWEKYIKRIERFVEKNNDNPKTVYSEEYDIVNCEKNLMLYDILTEKMSASAYKKLPANPVETLKNGREKFINADIVNQSKCLLQILTVFARINGSDLRIVGGKEHSAHIEINASLSGWKKNYSDVRIVDSSASGLYTQKTANLLEMI